MVVTQAVPPADLPADPQARLTQKPTFVGDAVGASSAVPSATVIKSTPEVLVWLENTMLAMTIGGTAIGMLGGAGGGVDVNEVYPTDPFTRESEIAIPGRIPRQAIRSSGRSYRTADWVK
jgi:hypothetical protein